VRNGIGEVVIRSAAPGERERGGAERGRRENIASKPRAAPFFAERRREGGWRMPGDSNSEASVGRLRARVGGIGEEVVTGADADTMQDSTS